MSNGLPMMTASPKRSDVALGLSLRKTLREILPGPAERAVLVGKTGTGKTTFAKYALRSYPYVVVLDTKGLLHWPGFRRVERLSELGEIEPQKFPHLIYSPVWDEYKDKGVIESFFEWVYLRRNTVLYVDEVSSLVETAANTALPEFYRACLQRGRELGIGVWTATQRPSWVPNVVFSESEHFYVWHLTLTGDLAKVEGMIEEELPPLVGHQFYHKKLGQSGKIYILKGVR